MAITRMLASGKAAVRHAAALLGEVTYAANNCPVEETLPSGAIVTRLRRDSQPKPPSCNGYIRRAAIPAGDVHQPVDPGLVLMCPDDIRRAERRLGSGPPRSNSAANTVTRRRRAEEEAHLLRRVHEIGSEGMVPLDGQRPSAAERMASLKRRVLERAAAGSAVASLA